MLTTMDITMARGPLMPSPLLLLSPRLMLMPTTDTTDTLLPTTDTDMPAMDTMDTHMLTTMDITMARGPLMPSPLLLLSPRLMLMPTTDTMDTLLPTTDTDMPAMDTMDTHMPTTMDITMARGPLMPSPLLMLP